MHPYKTDELINKGWSEEEIKKAEQILNKTEHQDIFFSKMIFWSALIVIIFANLLVSVILIPLLVLLNSWGLYLIIAFFGVVVGFLYNFLLINISHLERKHHLLAGIIISSLALINLLFVVIISNRFIQKLNIQNSVHNSLLVGITFVIAFIIPYFISVLRGKHQIN